jgi:hypothetical protein
MWQAIQVLGVCRLNLEFRGLFTGSSNRLFSPQFLQAMVTLMLQSDDSSRLRVRVYKYKESCCVETQRKEHQVTLQR